MFRLNPTTLIFLIVFTFSNIIYANSKSICGPSDDRELSFELPVGRLSALNKNFGCTVTLIGKTCAITAGHCYSVLEKVEFNVTTLQNKNINFTRTPLIVFLLSLN